MRKILVRSLLYLVVFIACSCSKDDPTVPQEDNRDKGKIVASIDNTNWVSTSSVVLLTAGGVKIGGLKETGENKSGFDITLQATKTGTYQIGENSVHSAYYMANLFSSGSSYFSHKSGAGGQVVLSEIDIKNKTLSGTFTLTLVEIKGQTINITDGKFTKIPYESDSDDDFTREMHAKVNGASFSPISVYFFDAGIGFISLNCALDRESISFTLPSDIDLGTYSFDEFDATYRNGSDTYSNSQSGTFTIISHDKKAKIIEGNFQFTAVKYSTTDAVNITEGYFKGGYN